MNKLKLSELEAMFIKIRKHLDETGNRIRLIPTKLIFRPSSLDELGLTADEFIKMIKEKNT